MFAYFTNAATIRRLAGWGDDVFSARSLVVQRRFLEKAVYRLLGPRQAEGAAEEKAPRRKKNV